MYLKYSTKVQKNPEITKYFGHFFHRHQKGQGPASWSEASPWQLILNTIVGPVTTFAIITIPDL